MNCKLIGSYVKHLEIDLSPGEEFYGERGSMIYLEEGIEMSSELVGNTLGRILGAKLAGESLILLRFYNTTNRICRLVLGSRTGLLHMKLEGRELICRRGAYVASSKKVNVSTQLSIAGLLGGMGALLQRISGHATIFLETDGDPVIVDLQPGQTIRIDENHFLALEGIPENRISAKWSLRNYLGGEGISMLTVTGPGRVYLNPGRVMNII
ncbi:MAG: AIM24 family protein [Bacteroides sp.]|nr:AIM24 family protein [Bacteroidales bacterium]MBD5293166.1 AIM24 family protein [Bacteroides sp.]MBD5339636.1 AIM24 family protein [Bacteroides sp.]